ncbi:MAG: thioredoxin domain-containing protein [Pseudomonadota bacterium]
MRASPLLFALLTLGACQQGGPVTTEPAAKFQMPLPTASADTAPDQVVATWAGGKLTYGEVMEEAKGQLIKQEIEYLTQRYSTMRRAIDGKVNEALMQAEAKKRGLADADALVEQINQQHTEVTDAEISSFYDENKRRFRGKPLEQIKDAVKGQLVSSKQREAVNALVEQLRNESSVDVALEPPELPRLEVANGTQAARGPENAPITVVEFADYECPYCSRGYETMKAVYEKYDGKVKWYFRDFPLSFHQNAMAYATAAHCAGEQGKYWEMHDAILDNQKSIDAKGGPTGLAKELGLTEAAFASCMENKEITKRIMEDMTDAQSVGVTGTPAYFVNGIMVSGAQPIEAFSTIIDRELEAAGQGK